AERAANLGRVFVECIDLAAGGQQTQQLLAHLPIVVAGIEHELDASLRCERQRLIVELAQAFPTLRGHRETRGHRPYLRSRAERSLLFVRRLRWRRLLAAASVTERSIPGG